MDAEECSSRRACQASQYTVGVGGLKPWDPYFPVRLWDTSAPSIHRTAQSQDERLDR